MGRCGARNWPLISLRQCAQLMSVCKKTTRTQNTMDIEFQLIDLNPISHRLAEKQQLKWIEVGLRCLKSCSSLVGYAYATLYLSFHVQYIVTFYSSADGSYVGLQKMDLHYLQICNRVGLCMRVLCTYVCINICLYACMYEET